MCILDLCEEKNYFDKIESIWAFSHHTDTYCLSALFDRIGLNIEMNTILFHA